LRPPLLVGSGPGQHQLRAGSLDDGPAAHRGALRRGQRGDVDEALRREGRAGPRRECPQGEHSKAVRRVISPETSASVIQIMKTVMDEGGTGRAARPAGFEAAGKTGTAQKALANGKGYSDKRLSSFFGFAPVDNPQVAITVMIDEPQGTSYGGVVAAPAFKHCEQVLPGMGVYPKGVAYLAKAGSGWTAEREERAAGPAAQPAAPEVSEDPGVMPDFSGKSLRQVMLTGQHLGLDLKLVGSGRAVSRIRPRAMFFRGKFGGW